MSATRYHSPTFKGRIVLLLLLALALSTRGADTTMAERNNAFACDLYAQLKTQPGNLFLSPYSISACLAMAYAGARGDTAKQMSKVLHLGSNPAEVHASFEQLRNHLNTAALESGVELNIANGMWAQVGHPFLPEFLNVVTGKYKGRLTQLDFKTQADSAVQDINDWVGEQTRGRIQNILSPRSLNVWTRLVLANAVYFKGTWAKRFDTNDTEPAPFHLSPTNHLDVPFMHHLVGIPYVETESFQAVEMLYAGSTFSMAVFLPRQLDGLTEFETGLTAGFVSRWLHRMTNQTVELHLPRFKLESTFELSKPLKQMAMRDAFSGQADFSGMDRTRDLFISSVAHKAWGQVDEQGTEAAAATVLSVFATAIEKPPPPPPVFRADHPFLFLIIDRGSGAILFMGRFSNPRYSSF